MITDARAPLSLSSVEAMETARWGCRATLINLDYYYVKNVQM